MSGKGLLKRIKGGLKIVAAAIPMVLFAGGILMCGGSLAGIVVNEDRIQEYYKSEVVDAKIAQELAKVEEQAKSGEIEYAESVKMYDDLKSSKHKDEVVNEIYGDNIEYKAILKGCNGSIIALATGFGSVFVGGLATVAMYEGGFGSELLESAAKDFAAAKNCDIDSKKKKVKKLSKEIEEEECVRE